MTTRRDLIKLASALGIAGTVPTAAERVAAAQALDPMISDYLISDPGGFAVEIHQSIGNGHELGNDWYGVICPEEWASFNLAENRVSAAHEAHNIDRSEVGDIGGEAVALALAMYDAGLRHGAAYENLRRSLVGETMACRDCLGTGIPMKSRDARDTCTTCRGTGVVAVTR